MKNKYVLIITTLLLSNLVKSQDITKKTASSESEKEIAKAVEDVIKNKATGADADGWNVTFTGNLNYTNTSLSNWAAGGQNSQSILATANFTSKYKKNKFLWDVISNFGYGFVQVLGNPELQKSDDRIDIISRTGYKFNNKMLGSLMANYKSQFNATFRNNALISNFMAPAFIMVGLGIDYQIKPWLSIFLSPATGRIVVVNDQRLADAGAFGVEPAQFDPLTGLKIRDGQNLRNEFGAYLMAFFNKQLFSNLTLQSKLELFNNYTDKITSNRANFDVWWDNTLTFKINKWFGGSFIYQLIYDENTNIAYTAPDGTPKVGPIAQMRSVLGIGLSYQLQYKNQAQ
jgi:hypothetical protein